MIRGDANASIPVRLSNSRDTLFKYFCERMGLFPVLTNHKTYHHFTGNGSSDSAIDVILHRNSSADTSENIKTITCSKTDPRVDSKHDIIVTEFKLPFLGTKPPPMVEKPPSIINTKHRIKWSEEGILDYRNLLSPRLQNIQNNWRNPASPISFSVLLQCTNEALTAAAKLSNKSIDLSKELPPKRIFKVPEVTAAEKVKKTAHNNLQKATSDPSTTPLQLSMAKDAFSDARGAHRRVWRRHQANAEQERDRKLSSICTKNPSEAYKHLKTARASSSKKISEIKVGDTVYSDKDVATGFYHNIENLKTNLDPATENCSTCISFKFDHKLITEICKAGEKIPPLSLIEAEKLLHSLKPSVCDHWSISANHYINGGPIALKHFQLLMNLAFDDIENTTFDEVNTAHACILYKGH